MKPILYSYWRSSCSFRIRIALNFKGVQYEYKPIHLLKDGGQQLQQDFTNLNPKQEVPLFVHEGFSVGQSMAILQYIEDTWKAPELFPKDTKFKALCFHLCEMINSGIQPLQNLKVMQVIGKRYNADEQERASWSQYWIFEGLRALEIELAKSAGHFSIQDTVTAADLFLFPQCYNAKRFKINLAEKLPTIFQIYNNCLELEEFRRALPEVQPDRQQ